MAECSYARCVQQRRNIRRELQRWTRNMVHIVGLERIAEELMGRRKWKLYQESMSRSYLQPLNNNIKTTTTTTITTPTTNQENYYNNNNNNNNKDQFGLIGTTEQQLQQYEEYTKKDQELVQHEKDKFISLTIKREDEKNDTEIEQKENEKILLQQQQQQQQRIIVDERLKDWTPETKCYFCVDGKLDSENNTAPGVLSPRQSDSDSSDSHSDNDIPPSLTPSTTSLLNNNNNSSNNNNNSNNHNYHRSHHHYHNNNNNNHHHPHHHYHHPHNLQSPNIHPAVAPINMTTMESVTSMALAAAFAGGGNSPGTAPATATPLSFYTPSLLTHNWYHLANVARTFQTTDRLTPAGDNDKNITVGSGGGGGGGVGEQPLDLSKGSNNTINNNINNNNNSNHHHANNVRLPTLDTKHIFNSDFRAKPRMSAVASRRTYTEDELQAALRDIQSGKLGTRRAAVIYGIPRSTLRNKVYKLALERERESHLNSSTTPLKLDEEEVMDDDKELSGAEEEKEVEKALQAPLCDILRLSNMEIPVDVIKNIVQKGKDGQENWGVEHSELGPYIQNLLLASQNLLTNQKTLDSTILSNVMPEFLKRIIVEEQSKLPSSQLLQQTQLNNGENDKLMRPSPSNSVTSNKPDRLRSESDMETDESPSNVILKIPSFKPTSSKNGCDLFNRNQMDTNSIVSPPIITNESNSPPILSTKLTIKDVKDVIAQSISQKFQQNLEPARRPPPPPPPPLPPPPSLMEMDYKRGTYTPPLSGGISVIKTQDLTRSPYQQQQHQVKPQPNSASNSGNNNNNNNNNNSSQAGGKGTRPKRGKYRNYDRDSLVEAVRAVQRGEMSVHRAGSYYGVPHSTLEYKVKERHLMRPRKRDPKPNPVDEKIASLKQNDIRSTQDKLKLTNNNNNNNSGGGNNNSNNSGPMKPPQKFPPTSPNGMKLPLFGEAAGMAPLPGYNPAPFPFWPHPGYHIPIDFARNPTTTTTPPFPPNPEFFASQMMQKLQEDSSRTPPTTTTTVPPITTTTTTTTSSTMNPNAITTPALAKSARQIAESLLDGTGSNGSFLDGIIRSSLEQGVPTPEEKSPKEEKNVAPENMSNKALLEQLCRNSRLTPLTKPPILTEPNSSGDESYRKGSSPLNFSGASREPDSSPPLHYDRSDSSTNLIASTSDLPTIELSNDSNEEDSSDKRSLRDNDERLQTTSPQQQQQPPRIYLKKDLTNPDNLQPEMLMRFRDLLPDAERNGVVSDGGSGGGSIITTGSASDNDAPQD